MRKCCKETASLKDAEILDLRDEAKEREGFIKTLIDKMAGKDAGISQLRATHKAELERVLKMFELRRFDVGGLLWVLTDKEYQDLKASLARIGDKKNETY